MNPAAPIHHEEDPSAVALRGASLAFTRKPPAPTPIKKDNGALTAATTSASRPRSPMRTTSASPSVHHAGHQYAHGTAMAAAQHHAGQVFAQSTGGSVSDVGAGDGFLHPGLSQWHGNGRGSVAVDPKSPSFIAATLAASRSASPSPKAQTPRRTSSIGAFSVLSLGAGSDVVDSASIPPTGSLISMFEKDRFSTPARRPSPRRVSTDEAIRTGRIAVAQPSTILLPTKGAGTSPRETSTPAANGIGQHRNKSPLSRPTAAPSLTPKTTLRPDGQRDGVNGDPVKSPSTKPLSNQKPKLPTKIEDRTGKATPSAAKPTDLSSSRAKSKRQPDTVSARTRNEAQRPPTPAKPTPLTKVPLAESKTQSPNNTTPRRVRTRSLDESPPRMKNLVSRSATTKPRPKPKPKALETPAVVSRSTPEVLSPQPVRVVSLNTEQPHIVDRGHASVSPLQVTKLDKGLPMAVQRAPTPPKPRGSNRDKPNQVQHVQSQSFGKNTVGSAASRPKLADPRAMRHDSMDTTSSNDTFVSASSEQTLEKVSPQLPPATRNQPFIVSAPPSPTHDNPRVRQSGTPNRNLPLNSLTSAIMAGSLASSRLTPHNTGSSLPPPAPPKRLKSPRLLQTLRQAPTHDSDEEGSRHRKDHHLRRLQKGKHSHHEGSRKRYRDEIRPRERKRYEAVWASNRGNLVPPPYKDPNKDGAVSEYVVNVVVREIWKRSRLPDDELTEVWNLVDKDGRGVLGRQAFVVGMWLIDQRLRGRKIPPRVSDSVWGSANGFRVKQPKHK